MSQGSFYMPIYVQCGSQAITPKLEGGNMRIPSIFVAIVFAGLSFAYAEPDPDSPYTVEQLREILAKPAATSLIPELDAVGKDALQARPLASEVKARAAEITGEYPVLTYTQYRAFKRTGERPPYQTPLGVRNSRLSTLAFSAWINNDDSRLDDINDLLWAKCEETTWVLPAHEKEEFPNIDLHAAGDSSELAHILMLIGERLPEEVRERVRREIFSRVLDPYLANPTQYAWNRGRSNWAGVCAGSIGEAFLLLENNPDRLAEALNHVLGQLERYRDIAFTEEGASLEGVGYWCYGLTHYVEFAEMLRARTNGTIDLLAHPKMKLIAQYPAVAALGKHVFASFSDNEEEESLTPYVVYKIAERTGVNELTLQASESLLSSASGMLRNLVWVRDESKQAPVIQDAFLPQSGIVKVVGKASGKRVILMAKAGHNDEPHNHCDVGSFILRYGDTTYFCDPGSGIYNADYFSSKRYESIFANSYGHSVPRIGGHLQSPGPQFRGALEKTGDKSFRLELAGAYEVPGLKSATRTMALLPDGSVVAEVMYRFDAPGVPVEEVFMTWLDAAADKNEVRVMSPEGVVTLHADDGTFSVERLDVVGKANRSDGKTLSRITLTRSADAQLRDKYTFTFAPVAAPSP